VRNATPIIDWAKGKRKLRIFVAADFSAASGAALRWARWLSQFGSCDFTVAYAESPLTAEEMWDPESSPGTAPLVAKIEQSEEHCFRDRVRKLLSTDRLKVAFEKGWGRSDAHLLQLAERDRADLIVVGVNHRQGIRKIAHHSVSRAILRYAPTNVACIPSHAFHGAQAK
jgi:nucleotide-binding universal stress UspA family protein